MDNETLNTILWICGGIATISTAIGIITRYFRKHVIVISKEVANEVGDTLVNKVTLTLDEIKEKLDNFEDNLNSYEKSTDEMLMGIARDRLNSAYDYYMQLGRIDDHSMFTLEELYKSYEIRGGNGQVQVQMENLRDLYKKSTANAK